MTKRKKLLRNILASILFTWSGIAVAAQPFADVHIHFNWDQQELIDARSIIAKLEQAEVEFAVVAGTPAELALELADASDGRVIPLFSPYIHEMGRQDWYLQQRVVEQAKIGLEAGDYRGIGEIHFISGFQPRADNRIFRQLMALAVENQVPVLIHVDSGTETAFLDICGAYPSLDILFAHAGGNLYPSHIRRIIEYCPKVWIEFSARDPWRYGGIASEEGQLLPEWRDLVIEHPDRFVIGTDPVWRVTRTQSWDLADDGWDYFEQLIAWHRNWLEGLPENVRRKLSVENARRLFDRTAPG